MARVLIVYGTTDGHTAKVARRMGQMLTAAGIASTTVVQPAGSFPWPDDYDAVIVAASVHGGKFQRNVCRWVQIYADRLNAKPSAFVPICLGILQRDPAVQHEIRRIVDRFLLGSDWRPSATLTVAGALPYTRYNWMKRWMMRRIVAKAGGDTDTSRDYEYTDWEALRTFCEQFAKSVAVGEQPVAASA
jgi:menaquinone-dependent protoporphyrinogen oxidase